MIPRMSIHSLPRAMRDDDAIVPSWTLGDRMRKAMEIAGLGVGTMAEVMDVDRATISRWIHDKSPVRRSSLTLWAIATGVDRTWLETGTAGLEETGGDQYAIRDSNPEPADMSSRHLWIVRSQPSVNRRLTVDRIPAGWPIPEPPTPPRPRTSPETPGTRARHLSAVS